MKRMFAVLLSFMLVVTLMPTGLIQKASAANAATYFIPDSSRLRDTAQLSTGSTGTLLTRDRAFNVTNANLTITGTYSNVSGSTMGVKIEQMNLQSDNTWKADANRVTSGPVTEVAGSSNRFTTTVTLFSGMNRITLSGMQNTVTRSDVFYVMFDQIPYIANIKVSSGSTTFNLNEGARAVVPAQTIYLTGELRNATKATIGINGNTPVNGNLSEDGMLFSPPLNLTPGLNKLTIVISNGSNTLNVERELYYFDPNEPFTRLDLVRTEGGQPVYYSLLDHIPQVTEGSDIAGSETANLRVQMLVPYESMPFAGNATFVVNGSAPVVIPNANVIAEVIVPGSDGVSPQYRLVTFTLPTSFLLSGTGVTNRDQLVNLSVSYSTFTSMYNARFRYLPNEFLITNIEYLPDYTIGNALANSDREPLRGAEVSKSSFYILVTADKAVDFTTQALTATYLPLGVNALAVTRVAAASQPSDKTNSQYLYLVSDFNNGQQQVQFKLGSNSTSTYNANVSFISKSYIHVANLYDGQTYEFNSKQTSNSITLIGQFIGFTSLDTPQLFVNGVQQAEPTPDTNNSFSIPLNITASGPLVFGENRIIIKGVNVSGAGIRQEITKELRIYIIDTNISTIAKYMPSLSLADRQQFVSSDLTQYTPQQMEKIFNVTPEFQWDNGKYTTSELAYDLVIRGNGAKTLQLKFGSEDFVYQTIPDDSSPGLTQGTFVYRGTTYNYDIAGSEKDFIYRVRDIPFAAPGTHVFNLILINSAGSHTDQVLEITREVSPYRILAPRPTVGDQILVNKNFIRFDIEAEGASEVLIMGEPAVKRPDMNNRFVYDYTKLKKDKLNPIKIEIKRPGASLTDTVNVFYSSAVQVDSQEMQLLSSKHTAFSNNLTLTFPKNTVLQSAIPNSSGITKLYNSTQLLFGIADPTDGVVERRNDYGNIINVHNDARTPQGSLPITIPDYLVVRFASNTNTNNFTRISNMYWISGGVGERSDRGSNFYLPSTNGLAPYSIEGRFTEFELERKLKPSNRGSLTLKYDEQVVDDVSHTVTVFRYTDSGVWENIGGEVNTKARTITVPFDEFGYYMVAKLRKGYADVTNHTWARNILNGLYSKGIMTNMRFDEFGANDLTTRGEFATLIVKGLNLPINASGNQTFFDIIPGTRTSVWDYEHIETAARAGIVNGLSDGFFGPDMRITREEAAVMIARGLQLKMAINDSKLEANLAKSYVDSGSIHYYARPAIEAVSKAKIMVGSPITIPGEKKPMYSFNPRGNMTRAEAGKIAVALLLKHTSIFPKNLS